MKVTSALIPHKGGLHIGQVARATKKIQPIAHFYSHTYKKDPHYDTLEQRLRLIICIGCSKASLISLYLQTSAMKKPQKQTKNNFILYILSYLQDICKMKR